MQNLLSCDSLVFFEDGLTFVDCKSRCIAGRDRFLSNRVWTKAATLAMVTRTAMMVARTVTTERTVTTMAAARVMAEIVRTMMISIDHNDNNDDSDSNGRHV